MERAKLGLNIQYRERLNNEERVLYLGKIADMVSSLDRYEHTVWPEDYFDMLPPLNDINISFSTLFLKASLGTRDNQYVSVAELGLVSGKLFSKAELN